MLMRVVKSAYAVMGLGFALACGGAETADIKQTEGVTAEAQALATDESGEDRGPIGSACGGFKQRCCEGKYCNTGYECSPSTLTCLH